MKVVASFEELVLERDRLENPLGLVPTMGFLHEGHLSLVDQAKLNCASVVVSIFVNPTQFGPKEDLAAYPRNLERDLTLLEKSGVDLVWTPSNDQMYLPGHQTWVEVDQVTQTLEGAMRPGHFKGVTTVVAKLFNAIRPTRAYFGQKDAQQVAVIRQMIRDLNYPIDLIVCPIVRETDGLAMSSRNAYLSEGERKAASVLHRALQKAQASYLAGERDGEILRKMMHETLVAEPLAQPQYVSCADPITLQELNTITSGALLSMAVYIGSTRLIDNLVLQPGKE